MTLEEEELKLEEIKESLRAVEDIRARFRTQKRIVELMKIQSGIVARPKKKKAKKVEQ